MTSRKILLLLFTGCAVTLGLMLVSCEMKINTPSPIYSVGACKEVPPDTFNLDTIVGMLALEKRDSMAHGKDITAVQKMIAKLEASKADPHVLFPYQEYDSATYCILSGYETKEPWQPDQRKVARVIRLCREKADLLLHLVNNPTNYGSGDCSDARPVALVIYYAGGKEIASVRYNCGGHGLRPDPMDDLSRNCRLNEKGEALMQSIKLWE